MSETYRALTRKYRPQSFEDIVSQDHVSNTLMNAIRQNRLSHAYMFCGPRGVGKTTMARVLARVINQIDSNVDGESLNQTLNIIEMDAASNNKVEDVHHLRESVRIPPQNGRYKIFIVDEVHMLSKAAFNALLKTLEEPPEHAIFIFATTEPHKVLPTILSRVQRFDFKRIAVDEIVSRLKKIAEDESIRIDEESLHVIAKKADGALRDALGLMDQAIAFCGDQIEHSELLKALNVVGTDRLFEFMQCVKEKDADKGLSLIDTLLQEGYDIQEFLIGLTEHLRNLYVAHHSQQMYMVEASADTKERYQKAATHFSREDLLRMLHMISEGQIRLKDASQPRIQFEILLLKLVHMERSEQLKELLSELEEVKKNFRNHLNGDQKTPKPLKTEQKGETSSDDTDSEMNDEDDTPSHESEHPALNGTPASNEAPPEIAEEPDPGKNVGQVNETDPYDDEFDLGSPAILTDISEEVRKREHELNPVAVQSAESDDKGDQPSEERKLSIEWLNEKWSSFIDHLNEQSGFQKTLIFQLQRLKPSKLSGDTLVLQCDNAFARQMIEENGTELSLSLKEHTGFLLRFKAEVVNGSVQKSEASNPYERFREIQQQDPMLKELVSRFGAEIEY